MFGLLYKDVYNTRFQIILYSIISVIYVALYSSTPLEAEQQMDLYLSNFVIILILSIFTFTLILSSFQIDEKSNWEEFVLSNGVAKFKVISSKFLLGIFTSLISSVFLIISTIVKKYNSPFVMLDILNIFFIYNAINIIATSIIVVLYIVLGAIKASYVQILIHGALAGITYGICYSVASYFTDNPIGLFVSGGYLVIALLFALGFYFLALKLYRKKEF